MVGDVFGEGALTAAAMTGDVTRLFFSFVATNDDPNPNPTLADPSAPAPPAVVPPPVAEPMIPRGVCPNVKNGDA